MNIFQFHRIICFDCDIYPNYHLFTFSNTSHTLKSKANLNMLTREGKNRLRWMLHYEKYHNARFTCRHFGLSPSTFYLWKKKYKPDDLASLEDTASRRPKNLRKATWDFKTLVLINRFLEHKPSANSKTIRGFLQSQGVQLSATTIWRMLRKLKTIKQQHQNFS